MRRSARWTNDTGASGAVEPKKMRVQGRLRLVVLGLPVAVLAAGSAGQSIETLFAGNVSTPVGGAGVFDLVVGAVPITITGIDANLAAAAGTAFRCQVYTTPRTGPANLGSPLTWTLRAAGDGVGAGANQPSPVTLDRSIELAPDRSCGVAVVLVDQGGTQTARLLHTVGDGTNHFYSAPEVSLRLGASASSFLPTLYAQHGHIWNGRIHYSTGGTVGACCLADGRCLVTTSTGCTESAGTYQGDGAACGGPGCPPLLTGACCLPESCAARNRPDCIAEGGVYRGDGAACETAGCSVVPVAVDRDEPMSVGQLARYFAVQSHKHPDASDGDGTGDREHGCGHDGDGSYRAPSRAGRRWGVRRRHPRQVCNTPVLNGFE